MLGGQGPAVARRYGDESHGGGQAWLRRQHAGHHKPPYLKTTSGYFCLLNLQSRASHSGWTRSQSGSKRNPPPDHNFDAWQALPAL